MNPSIETGWEEFAAAAIHKDSPEEQFDAMRTAYFAGAHGVLLAILSSSTAEQIDARIDAFRKELLIWQTAEQQRAVR